MYVISHVGSADTNYGVVNSGSYGTDYALHRLLVCASGTSGTLSLYHGDTYSSTTSITYARRQARGRNGYPLQYEAAEVNSPSSNFGPFFSCRLLADQLVPVDFSSDPFEFVAGSFLWYVASLDGDGGLFFNLFGEEF